MALARPIKMKIDCANAYFQELHYEDALELYKSAIHQTPEPTIELVSCFKNAAKCAILLHDHREALRLIQEGERIKPTNDFIVLKLKCYAELTEFDNAKKIIEKLPENHGSQEITDHIIYMEGINSLWNDSYNASNMHKYHKAINLLEILMRKGVTPVGVVSLTAVNFAKLGLFDEVDKLIKLMRMRKNCNNANAELYINGMSCFMKFELDSAIKCFQNLLLQSENRKDRITTEEALQQATKVKEINDKIENEIGDKLQNYDELVTFYTEPNVLRRAILTRRGLLKQKLQDHYNALNDFSEALLIGSDPQLLAHRSTSYRIMGLFDYACRDLENSYSITADEKLTKDILYLKSGQEELKKLVNPLEVLGIRHISEATKRFRELSKILHPDKLAEMPYEKQEEQNAIYLAIVEAHRQCQEQIEKEKEKAKKEKNRKRK